LFNSSIIQLLVNCGEHKQYDGCDAAISKDDAINACKQQWAINMEVISLIRKNRIM